jgi:O-antigen/teichoic acid export membrane protein
MTYSSKILNPLLSKYPFLRRSLGSFLWRLTQIIFKQGTTAVMFFIATYLLTKEDMGIYVYVSSALLLLALFTDFGISTSTSRYITLYNSEEKEKVGKVFFNSSLVIFLVSVIVITIVFLFRESLFPQYSNYLIYAFPMVFIYPMTSLMDGIFRGLKKFKKLAILTILNSVVGITASYFLVTNFQVIGAILAPLTYFTSYLIILVISYRGYKFNLDKKILKDIVTYAIYFGIAALGHYLFSKVNILILGSHNLLKEIAVYELLNKINTELLLPFFVMGHVLAPTVVEEFSKKNFLRIENQFKKILLYTLIFAIIFIPLSIVISTGIINILFPIYSGDIMQELLVPVTLTFATVIPVVVINAGMITSTGHAKIMALQNIISGTINVILNMFVIRQYGYVAVVWVTFVIQLISNIVLYLIYYSKLRKLRICSQ